LIEIQTHHKTENSIKKNLSVGAGTTSALIASVGGTVVTVAHVVCPIMIPITVVAGVGVACAAGYYKVVDDAQKQTEAKEQEHANNRNEIIDGITQAQSNLKYIEQKLEETNKAVQQSRECLDIITNSTNVFMVVGLSGHGKSTLANALCGKSHFAVSDSAESTITGCEVIQCEIANVKSVVIDTPGLNADELDDDQAWAFDIYSASATDAIDNFKKCCPHINAFVFVINGISALKSGRLNKDIQEQLSKYSALFGSDNFWDRVLIVFTMMDRAYLHLWNISDDKESKFMAAIKSKFALAPDLKIPSIRFGEDYEMDVFRKQFMQKIGGKEPLVLNDRYILLQKMKELEKSAQLTTESIEDCEAKIQRMKRQLPEVDEDQKSIYKPGMFANGGHIYHEYKKKSFKNPAPFTMQHNE
jgi:predicted GTPase